jgi:hypothetical protein
MNKLNQMNDTEHWRKYSNCEDGYINVRKEKELNAFLNEFKDNCDSVTQINIEYDSNV